MPPHPLARLLTRPLTVRRAFSAPGSSLAPFPTTPTCPAPTCPCAPAPEFPDTHPIDRTSSLNGLVPTYALQVLVCTGRDDWPSRIEDGKPDEGDNAAATLKAVYGPRGSMFDLAHNISILNSSFPPSPPPSKSNSTEPSVYVLPSFTYIPRFPLLPGHPCPPPLVPESSYPSSLEFTRASDIMILICGHGGRDIRCGVLGPLLRAEFEDKLASVGGVRVLKGPRTEAGEPREERRNDATLERTARVGLVSHLGGHKFAGNVIIYFPPGHPPRAGSAEGRHPLAGMGIWYGRVGPANVEGIVRETVVGGRVIEELFRGGIGPGRRMMRL